MEEHTQIQNVSDSEFTAETAINRQEDPRILATSYMMYKIGKFSFFLREYSNFLTFKMRRSGQLLLVGININRTANPNYRNFDFCSNMFTFNTNPLASNS